MCGRYSLDEVDQLYDRYGMDSPQVVDLKPNTNIRPTNTMPVVVNEGGGNKLELMRWGIPRFIGPGKTKPVFNTRADKAFSSWKKMTLGQRALIPASSFYEWKTTASGKQPYAIHPINSDIFSFAGIWNQWKDEDGRDIKTYSIITTEPNKEMRDIHNRMPVILHRDDEARWLSHDNDDNADVLSEFLIPYDDNSLTIKPATI